MPWKDILEAAQTTDTVEVSTRVKKIIGLLIESEALKVPLGSRLSIYASAKHEKIPVECVGFSNEGLLLMPYGVMDGISPGDKVVFESTSQNIWVGDDLLGHVVNGEGKCIDGSQPKLNDSRPLYKESPSPLSRINEKDAFHTGIRSWDGFMSMGVGQRVGVFAGTGVGKSVLLGMIARNADSDVNVLALVGERGHEVNEFIHGVLGEEGMKKSVVVVATSDQTPLVRIRAAFVAKTIAEYFAEKGKKVLYMMDSVTRMAMAMRELGLSVGEPPTTKGYPPSVFSTLPKLLERAGRFGEGSITSIISVLLEADDIQDPIGDAVRGILDGHIVLDRNLANRGHYPAIDVTSSISRWMTEIVDEEHLQYAIKGRKALADYKEAEDLINVGAYVAGSNPDIDDAIQLHPPINEFLCQQILEYADPAELKEKMAQVLEVPS
ncbi:MAG: FliI/YscN family ATPase [Planctomycetes bacterium]|nr:FliI/YscN family ATPase [Planctomycetota bacterium]